MFKIAKLEYAALLMNYKNVYLKEIEIKQLVKRSWIETAQEAIAFLLFMLKLQKPHK